MGRFLQIGDYSQTGKLNMPPKDKSKLTHEDIQFLKCIQEIEKDPEKYPGTDMTEHPANTSVIKEFSDLSPEKIRYRIRPDERGLENLGYIRLYDPELTEDGRMGPWSVTLTENGSKAIVDWEKRHGEINPDGWDVTTVEQIEIEISQIQDRLQMLEASLDQLEVEGGGATNSQQFRELESRVDAINERVKTLDDAPMGAWDDDRAQAIEGLFQSASGMVRLFEALGIEDVNAASTDEFDPELARQKIRETILGGDLPYSTEASPEQNADEETPAALDPSSDHPDIDEDLINDVRNDPAVNPDDNN